MDTSSVPLLNYGLQYQWCSDSDLSSISSPETLSPVHSMDSSLSPSYQQPPQSTPKAAKSGYSQSLKSSPCSLSGRGRKSGRATRIRSKQRESASEKEKLRMRDLTKALHHLRSYLPPSVAPAGQTLTKIETLRLTIRYISYLSAQLGLSEEVLFQRREQGDTSASDTSSPDILSYFQQGSMGGQEAQLQNQNRNHGLYPAQCHSQNTMLHSGSCSFGVDQYNKPYSEAPQGDSSMDTILQSPPTTQPSCQVTPCPGAGLFPMGPPGLGVSPAPRASQDQRWLPEVQPHTSHHIYGAASLFLLTIL
ncbi:mesoderm posterior protein 1-like [Xiphias gladius]|uniref:mesoderm posterior protein 1-like n=1 Tax=Xiphias gladius TaxID=8245 RepID=UPI001A989410|nr:mesoderm posterior protein 1-like [Xiphias gladius]